MAEKTVEKSAFLERVPDLREGKWGGMPDADGEALTADILKGGESAVRAIIGGLQEVDDGTDWKERLLLHMLATDCSVPERKNERAMLTDVYIAEATSDRPAPVRAFLVQQARFIADESALPKLAPLLRDDDVLVLDAVTAAMVSIGAKSEGVLREAMQGADGHARTAIEHALRQIE